MSVIIATPARFAEVMAENPGAVERISDRVARVAGLTYVVDLWGEAA